MFAAVAAIPIQKLWRMLRTRKGRMENVYTVALVLKLCNKGGKRIDRRIFIMAGGGDCGKRHAV